ncbi:MAG: FAD-binding oxidoreductase [Promethearchaeota archaeon]|nr:MAG: FAD-binding oxidoreductase [Candidatus Lokiarchaeota archaeon]
MQTKILIRAEIIEKLKEILQGEQYVSSDIEVRSNYSRDMTEQVAPALTDVVVLPENREQVQQIVLLANKERIPIIPYVAGANIGGLTLPTERGGITIDFKRMRRVIKIDRENKYIVVEPGFTFGDLRRLFDTEIPEFRYSFPFSPPYTSVGINALLHGLGSLSVLYGSADNFINGLEVVLPTGEIAQVGNHAINRGEYWYGRSPLPDLCGLFIGMQGTTGIATKISLQLMDNPEILTHFAILPKDPLDFFGNWVHDLDKLHICDEIGCGYFPPKVAHGLLPHDMIELMAKLMFMLSKGRNTKIMKKLWAFIKKLPGKPFWYVKKFSPILARKLPPEDEPFLIVGATIGANNKKLFKVKVKTLKKFMKKKEALMIRPDDFGELKPAMMSILDLPAQLPAFFDLKGGGLTWVGSYVPPSRVAEGVERCKEIIMQHGLFPIGVLRPMKADHYFVLRFIISFNSIDKEEIERVKKTLRGICEVVLDIGGVPYKMAPWAAKLTWEKGDISFYKLLKRVKDMMDPNNIMNPGKLFVLNKDEIKRKEAEEMQ